MMATLSHFRTSDTIVRSVVAIKLKLLLVGGLPRGYDKMLALHKGYIVL